MAYDLEIKIASKIDNLVKDIFKFSFTPIPANLQPGPRDPQPPIIHLTVLADEIKVRTKRNELLLNSENLPEALNAILISDPNDLNPRPTENPMKYLVLCFERLMTRKSRLLPQLDKFPSQLVKKSKEILDLSEELIVSYSTTVLMEPDMFPLTSLKNPHEEIVTLLIGEKTSRPAYDLLLRISVESTKQKSSGQVCFPIYQYLSNEIRKRARTDAPFSVEIADALSKITHCKGFGVELSSIISNELKALGKRGYSDIRIDKPSDLEIPPPPFGPENALYAMYMQMVKDKGHAISEGRRIERESFLGAFLEPSPASEPMMRTHFTQKLNRRQTNDLRALQQQFQRQWNDYISLISKSLLSVCKSSTEARIELIDWMSFALEVNEKRDRSRPDFNKVSSDGFSTNLCLALLSICGPIAELDKRHYDKIEASFILGPDPANASAKSLKSRAFPKDITRLAKSEDLPSEPDASNSTSEGSNTQAASVSSSSSENESETNNDRSFNFVTRCFFYGLRAISLGPLAGIRRLEPIGRQLSHIHSIAGEEGVGPNAPPSENRETFNILLGMRFSIETICLEPKNLLPACFKLQILACYWLLRSSLPKELFSPIIENLPIPAQLENIVTEVPLPYEMPMIMKLVPEHIVDDIAELFKIVAELSPEALDSLDDVSLQILLDSSIIFMGSPKLIPKSFIRTNFAECLYNVFLPNSAKDRQNPKMVGSKGQERRSQLLSTSVISKKFLASSLLTLYGACEETGFYAASSHRHHIAIFLQYIWKLESHRPAFHAFAETASITSNTTSNNAMDIESSKSSSSNSMETISTSATTTETSSSASIVESPFVNFANGILNQTNDGIANSLQHLRDIRKTQMEMVSEEWSKLPEEERQQKESTLRNNEQLVRHYMALANEVISFMASLSKDDIFAQAFTVPALLPRLAGMLSSVLVNLAGKGGIDLKVNEPEKYNFFPKKLLSQICETLLEIHSHSGDNRFALAVATGGYYAFDVFAKANNLVKKWGECTEEIFVRFGEFNKHIQDEANNVAKEEEELGEAPDEFLDPLMQTLMDDPVLLTTSNVTVDRSTIEQHLLNSKIDPFNRAPLSIDMIKPAVELKAKIDAWKASQRGKKN